MISCVETQTPRKGVGVASCILALDHTQGGNQRIIARQEVKKPHYGLECPLSKPKPQHRKPEKRRNFNTTELSCRGNHLGNKAKNTTQITGSWKRGYLEKSNRAMKKNYIKSVLKNNI